MKAVSASSIAVDWDSTVKDSHGFLEADVRPRWLAPGGNRGVARCDGACDFVMPTVDARYSAVTK
jgi:hypothetical protein